jgi:RNA polymerase sigma factor (sigma-70 family)
MADDQCTSVGKGLEGDRRLADLMRAAQDGDKAAYAQLLSEVALLLRRVVQRRSPFLQPSDVEDVVQEILISLHVARATYDPARPFLPWLLAIARNRLADAARRYARRAAHEVANEQAVETFLDRETNILTSAYGDPEALRHAIRGLPEGQRRAVELLKLREMSLKEAAVVTGMSIGALKAAVYRAMRTLRTVLGNEA